MKRLTMILSFILLFTTMSMAQQKQGDMTQKRQQMMEMMQSMMEDGEMNHSKMMEMMGDSSMMKMHMKCMQMMQGNIMDQKGMMKKGSKKGHKHQQHHN